MQSHRLAISAISTQAWSAIEDASRYAALNIRGIGLLREKLTGVNLSSYRRLLEEHRLTVTNLCFAGQFTLGVDQAVEDGRRALDEAFAMGAPTLLVISGPLRSRDMNRARGMVAEGLGRLAESAADCGVTLALEALHPMDMTAWSIIPTVGVALDILDEVRHSSMGLMLDLYNSWWDPGLEASIQRAGPRIVSVQLADWRNPTRSFTDRAIPGTGVADLGGLVRAVEAAGYQGFYDVEIFSDEIWKRPDDYPDMLEQCLLWWQGV